MYSKLIYYMAQLKKKKSSHIPIFTTLRDSGSGDSKKKNNCDY